MDPGAPKTTRVPALAKTVAKFAAAWTVILWFGGKDSRLDFFDHFVRNVISRVFAGFPAAAQMAESVYFDFLIMFGIAFAVTAVVGSFLAVLGALTRTVARARVRAGQTDFLDRPRAWLAAHPNAVRVLALIYPLLFGFAFFHPSHDDREHLQWFGGIARGAIPFLVSSWGVYAMEKKGVRELLAPTMGGSEAKTSFAISPDEIAFDAVAVTRETLAIVAVFTTLIATLPFIIAKLPILELFRNGEGAMYAFGGYIAFAAAGAYGFRKASRVAVGVDGVHVHGTSRARFFAYREIDEARVTRGDLELVRNGQVVLRLQLHGEDAARRDAVLGRITENIARVREGRGAAAAQLVASSTKDDLARLAHGAGNYRMTTLSREALWALVEGPEIEASARKAAAEALVRASDDAELARLRVAAERCAEPQVRVALEELVAEAGEPGAEGARLGLPPVGQ
jgi:hypothetical protein